MTFWTVPILLVLAGVVGCILISRSGKDSPGAGLSVVIGWGFLSAFVIFASWIVIGYLIIYR